MLLSDTIQSTKRRWLHSVLKHQYQPVRSSISDYDYTLAKRTVTVRSYNNVHYTEYKMMVLQTY